MTQTLSRPTDDLYIVFLTKKNFKLSKRESEHISRNSTIVEFLTHSFKMFVIKHHFLKLKAAELSVTIFVLWISGPLPNELHAASHSVRANRKPSKKK
ncbi:hypothetical protein TNCV_4696731 [Trichonephila clavipes]|nr:hypothetical protein TNCV_4696731 [Trichonephila clavipes]